MKHIKTVAVLALVSASAFADNVKVAIPSNAMKAAVDKETGRLRHLNEEENQELASQAANNKVANGLSSTTVTTVTTGVGNTVKAELGLSVLDELVVAPNNAVSGNKPTHVSTLKEASAQEIK